MSYFEGKLDFKNREIQSPFDFVKYLVLSLVLSPFRLILEVSFKILMVRFEIQTYLRNCIILNLIFLLGSIVTSFFISKKVYLQNSFIPLPTLVVSLVILCILLLFQNKASSFYFKEDYDEDFVDNEDSAVDEDSVERVSKPNVKEGTSKVESMFNLNRDEVQDNEEILTKDNLEDLIGDLVNSKQIHSNTNLNVEDLVSEVYEEVKDSVNNYPSKTKVKELYSDVKKNEKQHIDKMMNQLKDNEIREELSDKLSSLEETNYEIPMGLDCSGDDLLNSILNDNGYGSTPASNVAIDLSLESSDDLLEGAISIDDFFNKPKEDSPNEVKVEDEEIDDFEMEIESVDLETLSEYNQTVKEDDNINFTLEDDESDSKFTSLEEIKSNMQVVNFDDFGDVDDFMDDLCEDDYE